MILSTAFFNDPLIVFGIGLTLLILFFWYFATDVERKKRNVGTVLTIGVCAMCVLAATPPNERLKGGIDIIGGSSFTLKIQEREMDDGTKMPITDEQVEQAILVIEKRLNAMGTKEPLIARQGKDGILVQMPGVEPEESAKIRATLEKVAKLELREVSKRSEEPGADGKTLAQRVMDGSEIVPGYRAYTLKGKDEDGNEYKRAILLNRRMALGGSDIANAVASPTTPDAVSVTLNGDGANKMAALTNNMELRVDRIAVVLDGEVINAPTVNDRLYKNFEVSGLREPGEVKSLSNALMNPLENPLIVAEMRNISPTLGAAVVDQGIKAGILSLLVTFFIVFIYYRTSGIIANIGLVVNTLILFGVMAILGATFTLPGIAGMVLTVGMAVDANVLIYERLREEIAAGKSLKNAIDAAYDRAFSAIFDSHVTSLITAVALFMLGSGAIKGFAVTLTIGVTASLFSAILVTRVIFRWGIDLGWFKKLTFLNLIKATKYDFMGKRKVCIWFAIATIVASFAAFGIRGERSLGVDFTGGTRVLFQFEKDTKVTQAEAQKAIDSIRPQLSKEAYPQIETIPTAGPLLTVRCATKDTSLIIDKLRESIPALGEKKSGSEKFAVDVSQEEVSALIGGSFLKQSIIAIIIGFALIVLYMTMRFEFSFALGGFIAIFHDVIICVGIVVMLGDELSLIHVGAVLTIAGYSISDTIVVFDRIREMLLIRTDSVEKIMNEAINATLSRTLLTSTATLLSVLILSIVGGSALSDFGFIIFIGIIIGTFSSIFIASPIVLWWSNRGGRSIREDVLATAAKEEALSAAP
jgi:SecD/SecF fusion protein